MILQIKNMVCPRCLSSVRTILDELNLSYENIVLGKVEIIDELTTDQRTEFNKKLKAQGFELLSSEESKIVNAIKSFVIEKVHYTHHNSNSNLSEELSNHLYSSYTKLSKTFSRAEGITIEQFLLSQRIEKVKELLSYEEKNITEIALDLGYSSTAHLSGQFKKITGMSPSAFRKLSKKPRKALDDL